MAFSGIPVNHTHKKGIPHYAGYFVCGRGNDIPHAWTPAGWVGPAPCVIETDARIHKCILSSHRYALFGAGVPLRVW